MKSQLNKNDVYGKKKIVIAVTGLNAIDSPGPGIAVIRSIRECHDLDVYIIGLSYDALEPGIYMHDMVDKTYQIPYPSAGTQSLMERLMYIHELEHIDHYHAVERVQIEVGVVIEEVLLGDELDFVFVVEGVADCEHG